MKTTEYSRLCNASMAWECETCLFPGVDTPVRNLGKSSTSDYLRWWLSPQLEKPRRPWDLAYCFLDDNKSSSSENLRMRRRNIWKTGKQKLEPVSSTSRRVARAAYRDEYPRDFGPRIAYTVS